MELPSIKQIREFIPECTEISCCPEIDSCKEKNGRLCDNKDRPCYMTFKGEEVKGVILLNFKSNLVEIHKYGEKDEYARVITPEGVDVRVDGTEQKEKVKKMLKSIR